MKKITLEELFSICSDHVTMKLYIQREIDNNTKCYISFNSVDDCIQSEHFDAIKNKIVFSFDPGMESLNEGIYLHIILKG